MIDSATLRAEALAFARHLIGEAPHPEEEARYAAAVTALVEMHADAVVRVARAFPLLIGPLDAAAAILDRDHPLRQRLLLLVAILEASPYHVDRFLPRAWSVAETSALLARMIVLVPLRLVVGVPAFALLRLARV